MCSSRLVIVGLVSATCLTFVVASIPLVVSPESSLLAVLVRLFCILALGIGLGLAIRFVMLVRADIQRANVIKRHPGELVTLTCQFQRSTWKILGLLRKPTVAGSTSVGAMLTTVVLAADSRGVEIWYGVRRPRIVGEFAWSAIASIEASVLPSESPLPGLLSRNTTFPALKFRLNSGEELVMQIASSKGFGWAPAGGSELQRIRDALRGMNPELGQRERV